ncbi:MAG: hypothetical protein JO250_19840 [Armatimonadetes bacterium]|nr:hypothetical protein [Armatimonadota bacterium]
MGNDFAAGAAAVNIPHIGADYCARHGEILDPPEWPQQIRCLVLAWGEDLTVLFNADWGAWPRLIPETREIVARLAPGCSVETLCFATTASHNVDFDGIHWTALDPKDKRHDPVQRAQLLDAIRDAAAQALQTLRPASVAVGEGTCEGLAVNFYTGGEPVDSTVPVLRFADAEENLIAVLAGVACRTDDRDRHLSAGLAGAMAATVQKVYGPVPVFYFNTGSSDQYPLAADPPMELREQGRAAIQEARHRCSVREYGRLGRLLGGEVCKVLARLEVAGEPLLAQNERWRSTSWRRTAPGLRLDDPVVRVQSVPVRLWHRPIPSAAECDARVQALEAQMKPLTKALPYEPRHYAPYPLDPEDTGSDLHRLMELHSERSYWAGAAGRAKWEARYGKARQTHGEVKIIALGRDVALVCFPGHLSPAAMRPLKDRSPFPVTLFWGEMGPWNLGHLMFEAQGRLGGVHYGNCDYAQEAIDAMNAVLLQHLHALHEDLPPLNPDRLKGV